MVLLAFPFLSGHTPILSGVITLIDSVLCSAHTERIGVHEVVRIDVGQRCRHSLPTRACLPHHWKVHQTARSLYYRAQLSSIAGRVGLPLCPYQR